MQNNVYGQSPDFINTNFAQIIPQSVVPNIGAPQRNYMVDQNPEAFAHEAGLITGRIVSSILTASSVTDYMAREYEWMLIQELTELKRRFTRYFFSVKRSEDRIVVELYDPMGQLQRKELVVPFNKHEIRYWQLVAILDHITDNHGEESAQFIGRLGEIPFFFLRYLLRVSSDHTDPRLEEFSEIFKIERNIVTKQVDQASSVKVCVPSVSSNCEFTPEIGRMLMDHFIAAITNQFGIYGTSERRYNEILNDLLAHLIDDIDDVALPDVLNTPECKEDLKRIGVLEYGEDARFTVFFKNLITLVSASRFNTTK